MFQVLTAADTIYVFNTNNRTMLSTPGEFYMRDWTENAWKPYTALLKCKIGEPMEIEYEVDGVKKVQVTTQVEDIDLMEDPDQLWEAISD